MALSMVAGVSAGEGMECVEDVVVVGVVEVPAGGTCEAVGEGVERVGGVEVMGVVATGGVLPVRPSMVPALMIQLIKN
ncbi:hypothetical protein PF005_g13601 [Phytophthora fragariae]|uniref:Uncharacterized protein n=1 Tax=Phytophthora fragariae TaxID=53985 RepID=A0A6A3XM18_9STRA|nr:hypothetical protein PF003_g3735 [Phytophthora fragariae]KAE8937998.1 hypothetical protein PF009_g12104 [Phytophthora fragariae]KAE9101894.1 hypothetical protein PF010_g14297 [Phytophthora fragariae]KAE9103698.1 hypothetical protein PF007_g14312 [Phytophthora fragariae]KAE9141987.1 hypothetical protein PF006_g12867 [Phytophthora fragariae]